MDITQLQPQELWSQFAKICSIPHPSGHEAELAKYITEYAESLGLTWKKDDTGNIVVEKPATQGRRNSPIVILQSHIDMVPQKNSDKVFDFTQDPIETHVDGEWLKAKDTTLGADNGIGVASMLAILGSTNIEHPPLECLFTIEEETGLIGANGLADDILKGKLLINLDSEDEGELYVGCAGAVNNTVSLEYKEEQSETDSMGYEVSLKGLKGGHSGLQIIMQRGNANKLMTRFIREQTQQNNIRLSSFECGSLRNAIPREATAIITVPKQNIASFERSVKDFETTLTYENKFQEDAIIFNAKTVDTPSKVLSEKSQRRIINALTVTPNGVFRMSESMPGLVDTSTNIARVGIANGKLEALYMTRCMVNYGKLEVNAMIRSSWEMAKATVTEEGNYDGWAPNMNSTLLKTMKRCYEELYNKKPEIKAIHAGLECGIIGAKYPDMDMISIGPTMQYPHSPDERVNIETVKKFYDFLIYSLANI